MSYRTIIVGTDGSESSLRAVDRAGALAAQVKAKLIIASAHLDTSEKGGWSRAPSPDRVFDARAADSLGGAGYLMHGAPPCTRSFRMPANERRPPAPMTSKSERLSARQSPRCCIWPRRST